MSDSTRRKSRLGKRAVALSRVDRERLQRGELSYPEQALIHQDFVAQVPHAARGHTSLDTQDLTPHEREILENLPPHFGKI